MSTTFNVDDPAFQSGLSPANWYRNGSTFVRAINGGASVRLGFTGTSIGIAVDVSSLSGYSAALYPYIGWSIDGGSISRHQLLSSDTIISVATGLADTAHAITIWVSSLDGGFGTIRWDGSSSVTITGVVVDTGKTISAPVDPNGGVVIFFGDSISEYAIENPPGGQAGAFSMKAWTAAVAEQLGALDCRCAFSGQGWDVGIEGVPQFIDAWPDIMSGVSRSTSPAPRYIFIAHGQNGSADAGDVTATLEGMRSAYGASPYIQLMIPFSRSNETGITNGYNDYVSDNPGDDRITLINLGAAGKAIVDNTAYAPDGVHLNELGVTQMVPLIMPNVLGRYIRTAGNCAGSVLPGGIAL
jgi:hypothetical protein